AFSTPGLTEPARVSAVYDSILAARFDEAALRLKETCPPAPQPVCAALSAAALWWRILIDPSSRAYDDALERASADAVAAARDWTMREPLRGEAWFYLAAARAPRVNRLVLRGERLAAAREGKQIKDALERALAIDPSLDDAYFGIGLYHYYAAVAPMYAKLLRWLLALPGGDRARGLEEMTRARDRGAILRGEADFQLQQIDLWYEARPRDASPTCTTPTCTIATAARPRGRRCAIARARAACTTPRASSSAPTRARAMRARDFFDFFCRLCLTLLRSRLKSTSGMRMVNSSPSLVKLDCETFELALPKHRKVPRSEERRRPVSVPGGSHERMCTSALAENPT
ncbi:MAG: hypothetical protein DMF93_24490, partial [Acidobacteria bacterium]